MKRKIPYKSVVICSIILGIFISFQSKTLNLENNGMTTSKKGNELAVELRGLKKKEEELKLEIDAIKKSIDQYKENEGESAIQSEIEKYEVLAGFTDVEGEGIEIKIGDNSSQTKDINSDDSIIYNYDLLLSMINKLNSAQANAISINGERIISSTYIELKEDKLYINNTQIKAPITIKAIGDSNTLSSALQIKYGIVWEMEKYYNINVDIKRKENIKISSYNHDSKNNHSFYDN